MNKAKLVVVLLLLALGVYLATTSKFLPYGDKKKGLSHDFDCRGMLRKIRGGNRREGSFGCENSVTVVVEHRLMPFRGIGLRYKLSPPPPPANNKRTAMRSFAAPPPLVE